MADTRWSQYKVYRDFTRDRVKASPAWNLAAIIDETYEKRFQEHYGRSSYGWGRQTPLASA